MSDDYSDPDYELQNQLAEKDALIAKLQRVVDAARVFQLTPDDMNYKEDLALSAALDALDKETKG